MRVLRRWIVTEVLRGTAVVTAVFAALFLFFDFVDQLEDIGRGAYGLKEALFYVVLRLPSRLYELLPIVLLIGTITGDEEKSLFATSLMLTEKSESISVDDDHLIIKYQDADCAEKAQATLAVLKGMIKDAQASLVPVH